MRVMETEGFTLKARLLRRFASRLPDVGQAGSDTVILTGLRSGQALTRTGVIL